MIHFFGYRKCATCRKAEKHLQEQGLDYEFIDITLNPPSLELFKKIVELSGAELEAFYNTSGVSYREGNIKELKKNLSFEKQLKLLCSDGRLIKRPLIYDGKKSTVGFLAPVALVWKV